MNFQKPTRRTFLSAAMATLALPIFGAAQSKTEINGNSAGDKLKLKTAAPKPAKDSVELIIAILLYDKMTALDAIGPYEVLHRLPNAKVKFVGETAGLKTVDSQMLTLRADYSIDEVPHPDVLLIPGGDARVPRDSKKVIDWVTNAHKTTKYTVSVCTGALILGAAELLRGKEATTHWAFKEMLVEMHGAKYVPERYVQSGKIITAAGVSAGIDAALFLAEKLTDKQTAQMIQLVIEYDPQPPSNTGSLQKANRETVAAAKRYLKLN